MSAPRFLVSGLINLETTLQIESFPLAYNPVNYPFFGVNSTVSGVGYNLARALTVLGEAVTLLALIGDDPAGRQAREALAADAISGEGVLTGTHTAQSVILYDRDGRRQIHTDLKDIQAQVYPFERFTAALAACDVCALCNINYSRPFLQPARAAGRLVATDVHALSDLDDGYNQDFMRAADILFMSHERLPAPPEEWARAVQARYGNALIVIGLGAEGALLAVKADNFVGRFPAARTRAVVSTIGAGDALFSAFLRGYARTRDPYAALRRAQVFASWKIGTAGAAQGFLDAAGLEQLAAQPGA
jgi:ribokinase